MKNGEERERGFNINTHYHLMMYDVIIITHFQ